MEKAAQGPELFAREVRRFGDTDAEILYVRAKSPDDFPKHYPPVNPGVRVDNGIVIERDVAVTLRDGTTIYTDIYRPEGAKDTPAIVAWSPYGKGVSWKARDEIRTKTGTGSAGATKVLFPENVHSGYEKFEGPDPAYWCHYGYAVINPDPRGIGNSQGNVCWFGTQEAEDCYDLIEWVAARDWCNGKVGMQGNSWLAVVQWSAAALRPPHLACIAPWSGLTDIYRSLVARGGCVDAKFNGEINSVCRGHRGFEDPVVNFRDKPQLDAYWEDKIPKVENIEVPIYAVANYNNFHNSTLDGFRRAGSSRKWLRVENTLHWPDYYEPRNLDDLRRFSDRYLRGIHNGWEYTPKVRLSVYDPGGVDQLDRPEKEWPLARTQHLPLFLDAGKGTLSRTPPESKSSISYKADQQGEAAFTLKFDEDTELVGYWKLRLWVELESAEDLGVVVSLQKLDAQGRLLRLPIYGQPHGGLSGIMLVSHRALDENKSTPSEPYLTHRQPQRLRPGEVVPLEIPLWPLGMSWRKGEHLRVVVSSHFGQGEREFWMRMFGPELPGKGELIIHTGGEFDSHLLVPVT